MTNERKFLLAAVRETEPDPEGYELWAAAGFAEGLLAGCIGEVNETREK